MNSRAEMELVVRTPPRRRKYREGVSCKVLKIITLYNMRRFATTALPLAQNKAYQDSRTPLAGSGGPLRGAGPVCSLLGTGWGPRGDSGSARGRVRATQPASFSFSPFTPGALVRELLDARRRKPEEQFV